MKFIKRAQPNKRTYQQIRPRTEKRKPGPPALPTTGTGKEAVQLKRRGNFGKSRLQCQHEDMVIHHF
ncbi:hypothetical protein RchiOBHm_Chr7g0239191 [Rosa chinensis]|uniref:Uncharacterized protein n=1 Tax=Rosa chinensis TaxID=74649 RepID=A0A2P6PHM1_ROSCH|nr:hypothetical protein RchiOBHm_Chr7g0239191 [Rosa chinensis]